MSTKVTLAFDENERTFSLYQDHADGEMKHDYVYLEVLHCGGCGHAQTVRIPADVWECIRQVPSDDFSMVDLTDDEIRARVKGEVDDRIKGFREASTDRGRALAGLWGCGVYGDVEDPRDVQVLRGIENWIADRERQKGILRRASSFTIISQNK
jgi:hypothetical protein